MPSIPEIPQADPDTRARLIEAGTTLFSEKGFHGVSVKEIAKAAGVNISLISYHFGGKEKLYRACLEPFARERLLVAERILHPPQSREELIVRLRMYAEEVLNAHLQEPRITRILHRDIDLNYSMVEEVFRETFLKSFSTLVRFFEAAAEKSLLPAQATPQIIAGLLHGALIHMGKSDFLNKRLFGNTITDPAYRQKVIDHVLLFCTTGCIEHDERGKK